MLAVLLGAALLAPVPPAAVQVEQGRAFVSCGWLQQHREDLSCRQTPDSLALSDAFSPSVVWLIESAGRATSRPTQQGQVERAVTPPLNRTADHFLAARDLQRLLGVPVDWKAGQLWLGQTPSAVRAVARVQQADRDVANLRRQRGIPPGVGYSEMERLTLFPVGRADERCDWVEDTARCFAWRGGRWQATWAAQTERTAWDPWPTLASRALEAVLGQARTLRGQKPDWSGGLEYEGVSGHGMGHAVRRGRVAPGGQWTQVYEKSGTIDAAFAPNPPGGKTGN
ncbi:hypothetical protein DEIPH_ctg081orf0002 [Deinococcus phoenicis]|uniref:Uncharacterized protein n=1 Tax=Deinococcus phoenicis TaxID=1476583 RepID=A0A016QL79_9DEIO|nr:hypothetical protein [Deinococcus phoenicis]EYB66617.1 hypothetical protein DEIPH_ctg081orf0002 [Deinococcus phoenicis]